MAERRKYDPDACVTAEDLREAGIPVPENIPSCAWVPRSSIKTSVRMPKHSKADIEAGIIKATMGFEFTEAFEWVELEVPNAETCPTCGGSGLGSKPGVLACEDVCVGCAGKGRVRKDDVRVPSIVGTARKGPVGENFCITSYEEFLRIFGKPTKDPASLGSAVESFFQNGGRACLAARMVEDDFFICPKCEVEHSRGPLDPLSKVYRCLGCGYSGPKVMAEKKKEIPPIPTEVRDELDDDVKIYGNAFAEFSRGEWRRMDPTKVKLDLRNG